MGFRQGCEQRIGFAILPAMTQINSARALAWLVLAILAASLPTELVAQVVIRGEDATATVTVNVGQSGSHESGSPGWDFIYWRDDRVCWARSRTWRVYSNRERTGVYLLLDRFLQDRTGWVDIDWQLSDPSGGSPVSSGVTREYRLGYDYQAKVSFLVGDQSHLVDHWLKAWEQDPRNPPDRPFRDTELSMGDWFVDLVDPETGRPGTDILLGLDMRFRQPQYDQPGEWREWYPLGSMALELPTVGLARAIRATKACTADLPR